MKTVLFFTDMHTGAHATEYAGLCDSARARGWRMVEIEYARTERPAEEFIAEWRPAGVVVECGHMIGEVDVAAYTSVPAVFIDPRIPPASAGDLFVVEQDAQAIAALAYRELAALRPAACAFVGWSGSQSWSSRRAAAFADEARRTGGPQPLLFGSCWSRTDLLAFRRQLEDWLRTLPRPCGLWAANDETAARVADACLQAGLACPDDVAILGVDNDRLQCENNTPRLSSVEIDYRAVGRSAADLLELQLRRGAEARARTETYGPAGVVRRDSTKPLPMREPLVRKAQDLIRRRACEGLTAADVLHALPCSRRLAEQRFRLAVGHSIGEEILSARFQRVLEMLADPEQPISRIAAACGWESDSFLKRAFKKRTGLTMREWRAAHPSGQ